MDSFIEFCYSTVTRKTRKTDKVDKRPQSPSPFKKDFLNQYICSNLCCISDTNDLSDWIPVTYNKKTIYYFCSQTCWKQWLETPSTMGAWSPPLLPHNKKTEPETLSLLD